MIDPVWNECSPLEKLVLMGCSVSGALIGLLLGWGVTP